MSAGLPSPSSLRDATSPKVRGLGSPQSFRFYTSRPAAAKGAVRRYAQTSRLCQGLPLWERLPPAGGRCRICDRGRTAGAKRLRGRGRFRGDFAPVYFELTMGQTSERPNLNGRGAFLSAGLPSPSSLRDATSPKVRGLGSPPSLQFSTLRPAAVRGAVRRCAETFRLCQGLSLWESWREAPERARTLPGRLRPGLA